MPEMRVSSVRGLRSSGCRRCESPWYHAVVERFSYGEDLGQNVDVVDDGVGAFFLKEEDEVDVTRVGGRGDADEGNAGGARATRVIHGIADVVDLAAGVGLEDAQQALGIRFVVGDIFHADD